VAQQARLLQKLTNWSPRVQRLFACDCAEHVQPENTDSRYLEVIAVARRYAEGQATNEELGVAKLAVGDTVRTMASLAAWDATGDAAWAAAWLAARAGRLAAMRDAVENTMWVTAWGEERHGMKAAAWEAERRWQTERLFYYLGEE